MGEGISEERQFMNDYWAYRKKFYEPKQDSSYWMDLINEGNELVKKYNGNGYAEGIVLLCIDDLDLRFRKENIGKIENITFVPGELVDTAYHRIKKRNTGGSTS